MDSGDGHHIDQIAVGLEEFFQPILAVGVLGVGREIRRELIGVVHQLDVGIDGAQGFGKLPPFFVVADGVVTFDKCGTAPIQVRLVADAPILDVVLLGPVGVLQQVDRISIEPFASRNTDQGFSAEFPASATASSI